MKRLKTWVHNYIWFIKESQKYMEGSNKFTIFLKSLKKGFGFCKCMKGGRA